MWIDRRVLLLIGGGSLLLNIFLVGLLLGRAVPAAPVTPVAQHTGRPASGGTVGFVWISRIRQLDPADRKRFHEEINAHRPGIRAAREFLREQRRTTEADMTAPTFDRAKVAADLSALRQANDTVLQRVHDALLDAVGVLPLEARMALLPKRKPAPNEEAPPPADK